MNLTDTNFGKDGEPQGFPLGQNIEANASTEPAHDDAPELFTAHDLAVLESSTQAPRELEEVTRLLVKFCLEPEQMYGNGNGNPYFGRFAFFECEKTALETRALFRMAGAALDWLKADYLACETQEREDYRKRLAAFEALDLNIIEEETTHENDEL